MNSIFDKIREEYEESRKIRLQKGLEAHQKMLKELGVTEEQYLEEQRQIQNKERKREKIRNALRVLCIIFALIIVITLFQFRIVGDVLAIIALVFVSLLMFGVVYMGLSGLLDDWKMNNFWKKIIIVVLSIFVIVLICWAIGSSGVEDTQLIHERF